MGLADWDNDSTLIKEKLASAYGPHPTAGAVADAAQRHGFRTAGVAGPAPITYNSTGVVLTIEPRHRLEVQAKLAEAIKLLTSE